MGIRTLVRAGTLTLLPALSYALPFGHHLPALVQRKDDDDDDDDDDKKDKDDKDTVEWFGKEVDKTLFIGLVVGFILLCLVLGIGGEIWRRKHKKNKRLAAKANNQAQVESLPRPMIMNPNAGRAPSPQYISPPSPGGPNDTYANNQWANTNNGHSQPDNNPYDNQWAGHHGGNNNNNGGGGYGPYGNGAPENESSGQWGAPNGPPPPTYIQQAPGRW
jgi:hypothetical protein